MKQLITILLFVHLRAGAQTIVNLTPATDLQYSPVSIRIKKALSPGAVYQLTEPSTRKHMTAQATDSFTLVFIPLSTLKAGRSYSYQLSAPKTPNKAPVAITSVKNGLQISMHNKPVLFYHLT